MEISLKYLKIKMKVKVILLACGISVIKYLNVFRNATFKSDS